MTQQEYENKIKELEQQDPSIKELPYGNDVEIIPETVCQYTGLTDKNGTKIFEGDIIKTPKLYEKDSEKYWKVHYNGYEVLPFGLDDSEWGVFCWYIDDTEVVGNIYDNTELLPLLEDYGELK